MLIGAAATAANEVVREVVELVADLPDPVPVEFAREFQAGTIHHPVPQPFFDRIVAESVKAPARVWRDVVTGLLAYDDLSRLASIAVPTLVLGGEQDALFSPAEQAAVASAIPRARLSLYPDTGHCPNWERPERVAADIDASSARPDPAPLSVGHPRTNPPCDGYPDASWHLPIEWTGSERVPVLRISGDRPAAG